MKKLLFGVVLCLTICSCGSLSEAIKSAKTKNLAIGNDVWGGKFWVTMVGEESPLPSFGFSFGRSKTWYISLKDEATAKELAEIIRASNSSIEVKASGTSMSIKDGD